MIYLVMFANDFSAPELGYWFLCSTIEQVAELAKEAGMPKAPEPYPFNPGDWIEETGGIVEDRGTGSAMKVFAVDTLSVSHVENLKIMKEIMERSKG